MGALGARHSLPPLWRTLAINPDMRAAGADRRGWMPAREGRELAKWPSPHHILHKYQAPTAPAWPGTGDMVFAKRPFRPPLMDRPRTLFSQRWRYFAYELV